MKKLSKDLKIALTGLACQNAGEFLFRATLIKYHKFWRCPKARIKALL